MSSRMWKGSDGAVARPDDPVGRRHRCGLHATVAAHEGAHGQMVALRSTEIELLPLARWRR